jgi:hypothetical protein
MRKVSVVVCLVAVLLLGSVQGAFAANATYSNPGTTRLKKLFPVHTRPRTTVPEPATLAMVAVGLAGVGVLRRKKAI